MKKALLIFILLLTSLSVVGATPEQFVMYGANEENSNDGDYNGDYDVDGFVQKVVAYPDTHTNPADFPPLIGNLDSDPLLEMVIPLNPYPEVYFFENDTLWLKHDNINNGTPPAETKNPNWLLHDIDGDTDLELIYCGRDVGIDKIQAFNFTPTTTQLVWEYNISNKGEQLSACMVSVDGAVPQRNTSYLPKAFTLDSQEYAFFIGHDDGTGGGGNMLGIRINLGNGSAIETAFSGTVDNGECNNIYGQGATGAISPNSNVPHYGDTAVNPYMTPVTSFAVCVDPNDATNKVAYIPVDCKQGVTETRGVAAFDLRNNVGDTDMDNGYDPILDPEEEMSQIMCGESTTTDIVVFGFESSPEVFNVYRSLGGAFTNIAGENTAIDPDFIGSIWQGEYNDEGTLAFDDVCIYGADTSTQQGAIYCVDADDPITNDEVFASANYTRTGAHNMAPRPWLHTVTSFPSGQSGDFGDDSRDDFLLWHGMYSADPAGDDPRSSAEGAFKDNTGASVEKMYRFTNSIPPQDGTCSVLDMDGDSFMDVLCYNINNISLFFAGTENQVVDFKQMGVDVFGETMCTNSNQTFFVEYDTGNGYFDVENDPISIQVDCELNGSIVSKPFVTHGSNMEISCFYGTNGSHTAKVQLVDEGSGLQDFILHSTTTSGTAGCVIGDNFSSGTVADEPDTPVEPPVGETLDPIANLDGTLEGLGITDQTSKDFVWLMVIMGIMFTVWQRSKSAMLTLGIGVFSVLILSFTGLLSGVYGVGLIIISLFGFTIAGILSRRMM